MSKAKGSERQTGVRTKKSVSQSFFQEAARIRGLIQGIEKRDRDNLKPAIEVGRRLSETKAALKKSRGMKWIKWCETCLKVSRQTATSYIRVYEGHRKGKLKKATGLTDAYRLLRLRGKKEHGKDRIKDVASFREFTPDEAVTEFQRFVREGKLPTLQVSTETVGGLNRAVADALKKRASTIQKYEVVAIFATVKKSNPVEKPAGIATGKLAAK